MEQRQHLLDQLRKELAAENVPAVKELLELLVAAIGGEDPTPEEVEVALDAIRLCRRGK